MEHTADIKDKLDEVNQMLKDLSDSEPEDSWTEEMKLKNERVVQFLLDAETKRPENYGASFLSIFQKDKQNLRLKCLKKSVLTSHNPNGCLSTFFRSITLHF